MSDSQLPAADEFSTDPRVTAYVVGEMTAAETQAFEHEVDGSPELQASIAETRAVVDALAQQFQNEPTTNLSDEHRATIDSAANGRIGSKVESDPAQHQPSVSANSHGRSRLLALLTTVAALVTVFFVLDDWLRPDSDSVTNTPLQTRAIQLANATLDPAGDPQALESPSDEAAHNVRNIALADLQDKLQSGSPAASRLAVPGELYGPAKSNESLEARTEFESKYDDRGSDSPTQSDGQPVSQPAAEFGDAAGTGGRPVTAAPESAKNGGKSSDGISGDQSGPQRSQPAAVQDVVIVSGSAVKSPLHDTPSKSNRILSNGSEHSIEESVRKSQKARARESGLVPPVASAATPVDGPVPDSGAIVESVARKTSSPAATTRRYDVDRQQQLTTEVAEESAPFVGGGREVTGLSSAIVSGRRPESPLSDRNRNFGEDHYGINLRKSGRTTSLATVTGESYAPIVENEFIRPDGDAALSTFSVDVDTASYSNVRRFLTHHQLPPTNAVRIEELVNYFNYDYAEPVDGVPFSVHVEANTCPWNPQHRLVQIGLQGKTIPSSERPPINLVFLIDVSGSMRDANKLPLAKSSLQLLAAEMTEDDRIAIVTYAGDAGLKLDSTCGSDKQTIGDAIGALSAGGSTNGEAGIKLAYETAVRHFQEGGNNRVVVCTDGDFNVGNSSDNAMVRLIQDKAKSGVFLSIFGFGTGNLKDSKLEAIADRGNGHYAYVDGPQEAKKLFVEQMTGTLFTIAKDVKIQVEFNPGQVGAYRLIGYENRLMAARDFADDTKDAGEIGAGHHVTALYEVIPRSITTVSNKPLKYQQKKETEPRPVVDGSHETLTVALRYKQPDGAKSSLLEVALVDDYEKAQASDGFEWAAAVATFGMVLRQSKFVGDTSLSKAAKLALASKLNDKQGRRREFIEMVYRAMVIKARQSGQPAPEFPELSRDEADQKATVGGKYRKLLKVINVPEDREKFGNFADFGAWDGTSYAGQNDLPKGHWVYVYPNWYIFGEQTDVTNAGDEAAAPPAAHKDVTPKK